MGTLSCAELDVLVEQMRDIWSGRTAYKDDAEWLDNVEAIIDEVVRACDLEPIEMRTVPRDLEEMARRLGRE